MEILEVTVGGLISLVSSAAMIFINQKINSMKEQKMILSELGNMFINSLKWLEIQKINRSKLEPNFRNYWLENGKFQAENLISQIRKKDLRTQFRKISHGLSYFESIISQSGGTAESFLWRTLNYDHTITYTPLRDLKNQHLIDKKFINHWVDLDIEILKEHFSK